MRALWVSEHPLWRTRYFKISPVENPHLSRQPYWRICLFHLTSAIYVKCQKSIMMSDDQICQYGCLLKCFCLRNAPQNLIKMHIKMNFFKTHVNDFCMYFLMVSYLLATKMVSYLLATIHCPGCTLPGELRVLGRFSLVFPIKGSIPSRACPFLEKLNLEKTGFPKT